MVDKTTVSAFTPLSERHKGKDLLDIYKPRNRDPRVLADFNRPEVRAHVHYDDGKMIIFPHPD